MSTDESTARLRATHSAANNGTNYSGLEKTASAMEQGADTSTARDSTEKEKNGRQTTNGATHLTEAEKDNLRSFRGQRMKEFRHRVRGRHLDHVPTLKESLLATMRQSWLNIGLIFVVFSWISNFVGWDDRATFVLSFIALIPLEKLLQFCSHQSMLYLGHSVGDLLNVTLMNAIEAILAILLLRRPCELKLLQGTIIGVILLQLLLVPGVAFIAGGSRQVHQELHATQTQLNQSMMTMAVMCLVIPAAFFAGITPIGATSAEAVVTDEKRTTILTFSHGMAIIMLLVYIGSRIYQLNPPGEAEDSTEVYARGAHEAFRHEEEKLKTERPKISPWFCAVLLVVLIAVIAVTAEWLVDSIEFVRENTIIQEEWFGLILLPLISFSGDGVVTFSYLFQNAVFHHGKEPHALADAQPIDLAIQFSLFWTPLLILIGWWTGKPLPMLFDIFEIIVLVAACFVVNYITADAKTNWAEGFMMCCLYAAIALVAWFYPGQQFLEVFFGCIGDQVDHGLTNEALSNSTITEGASSAIETATHAVGELARRMF